MAEFTVGERVFSHLMMEWGNITHISGYEGPGTHGVTGDPLPGSTWYEVKFDSGKTAMLDDADGDWDMARIVPPRIAVKYGYGPDPRFTKEQNA